MLSVNIFSRQQKPHLLTWQAVTTKWTSCRRRKYSEENALELLLPHRKGKFASFILKKSNLCFLLAETVCRVYKSIMRDSAKRYFKWSPKDVFGKHVPHLQGLLALFSYLLSLPRKHKANADSENPHNLTPETSTTRKMKHRLHLWHISRSCK